MARRYFVEHLRQTDRVVLADEVGHHLARVMRARPGDVLRLFDGQGREAGGRIVAIRRGEVEVEVEAPAASDREPRCMLELAFAVPRGNRGEWIFEHGTEVGVRVFRPLRAARSAFAPSDDRRVRWQRLTQAACGQCDRAWIPQVEAVEALGDFVRRPDLPAERYMALPGAPPLGPARGERAALLVGPEGGLTTEEAELAQACGFEARSLGPLTLRSETAALVGAARLLA